VFGYVEVKLGDVGSFYSGLNGKSKTDFKDGNAKFISYINVFSNIALKTDVNDTVKISENEKQNTVEYGDIVFTGSSETVEECGMSSVLTEKTKENLYLNSFCFGYRLYDKQVLLPDFCKHLFRSEHLRKQIKKTASGVTRFNISKKKMEHVTIFIPTLKEQFRIASILNRFDKICNDLTEGLPAEIAARQKQYEFYRNKLLDFPEKKAID